MNRVAFFASVLVLGMAAGAHAQNAADSKLPPQDGMKLSAIIAKIEARPDFRYLESVEWERQGYYEITYHTSDKAKVEIKVDAASGESRD